MNAPVRRADWSRRPGAAPGRAKILPPASSLLLPYQARWVRDNARLKLAEKARQIGWSWAAAYRLVSRGSVGRGGLDAWVSSRDEIQARLFLDDCRHFLALLGHTAGPEGRQAITAELADGARCLELPSGRRIHALSSHPDAQAGKRGDRVLDEFALHPDPRRLYSIAYPGITWGGCLEIFSTHRGTDNFFHELVREARHLGNPKGFSLHRVTLADALEQGFLWKLQQKLPPGDPRLEMDEADYFDFIRRGCADEESFQQEYCCVPGDDQGAWLSYEMIAACEYAAGEPWQLTPAEAAEPAPGGPARALYAGVDVGRDHDLTVLWVVERVADVCFTRAVECLRDAPFDAQEAALAAWLEVPALRRCCVDATGVGRQFCERAQQRFGPARVERIHFTTAVKEELACPVRAAFESRRVRVPADPAVRADLRAIRKETTAAGNLRFQADRGRHGHADRFWALALALHAARQAEDPGPIRVFTGGRLARVLAERRQRALW